MAEAFTFDTWGADADDWNAGVPGIQIFANALQVWALCQQRTVSVLEAAEAFRVPPALILEAVEAHPWMFLTGPRDDYNRLTIEHEWD